jgi:hypothetical protein
MAVFVRGKELESSLRVVRTAIHHAHERLNL